MSVKSSSNVLVSVNVSNGRHLFGFSCSDFQFRIFDLYYNVDSCFKPRTDDKLTKDFVLFGRITKRFVFYAEPLDSNTLMIFYGTYGLHQLTITYCAVLQFNWRYRRYSILQDTNIRLNLPTMCSSRLLFNDRLILSNNKEKQINVYQLCRQSNELEQKKVIDCNRFSAVYWHVSHGMLLTFKADGGRCLLGKTSVDGNESQAEYTPIEGDFEKEWFSSTKIAAAWDSDKLFIIIHLRDQTKCIVFDLNGMRFHQLQHSHHSIMDSLSVGFAVLTSSSTFIMDFNLNVNSMRLHRPHQVNFVKPNQLSTLSFVALAKTPTMQRAMQDNPGIYQQDELLNKFLMDQILKLYNPRVPQQVLSRKRRFVVGCDCRYCRRSNVSPDQLRV